MDGKKYGSVLFLISMIVFAFSLPPMEGNGSFKLLEDVKMEYNYFIEHRDSIEGITKEYAEKTIERFEDEYKGKIKEELEFDIYYGIMRVFEKQIELLSYKKNTNEYIQKSKEIDEAIEMLKINIQVFEGL